MNKNKKLRLFLAAPLDYDTQEQLRQSLSLADIELPKRAVNPESWHITLYFIGTATQEEAKKLTDYFSSRTWPKKFELSLDHLGAFPKPEHAKILWCGVGSGVKALAELVEEISQLLIEAGFPPDSKFNSEFYRGHVTLSKMKEATDLSELADKLIRPTILPVERFVLFRSHADKGEQQYEELASFYLS